MTNNNPCFIRCFVFQQSSVDVALAEASNCLFGQLPDEAQNPQTGRAMHRATRAPRHHSPFGTHARTPSVTGSARHKNKIHTRRHRRAREIPNHNQLHTDTQHTRATHAHMASVRIRRAVHIRRDYYNHNDTTIRTNERKRKSERISSGRYSHLSGRSVIFYSSPRLVDYRRVPIRSTNCVFCVFLKVIHNSKWRTTPTTISTEHRSKP